MEDVRRAVREIYGKIGAAKNTSSGCCASSCCSGDAPASTVSPVETSRDLGYSGAELSSVPEGADLGLGCGNPQAIAALRPGETVLDLGSGGGLDCFLAAQQVGETGTVIGVDMTHEMISRARKNARKAGLSNVEFRLGEIERLPVPDGTVDVILSNCVINLSPDKPTVYAEAFRALKRGGRLAISDVVATVPIPEDVRENIELHVGCVAGAATVDELNSILADVGFTEIRITPNEKSRSFIRDWLPGSKLEDYVVSATIEAIRP